MTDLSNTPNADSTLSLNHHRKKNTIVFKNYTVKHNKISGKEHRKIIDPNRRPH